MGFYSQRCPNCGKSVSKDADYCNACGCPTATSWATCHTCGSSVGGDSKFCWKCGTPQDPDKRKHVFGERWRRSADDFAVRVELKNPSATLQRGLQIDDGTVGLLFQQGRFVGLVEPGYHATDSFFARLLGLDKGKEAHAVLIDTRAAELDFMLEDLRVQNQVPVDARLRLLFQVREPQLFAEKVVAGAADFSTSDLVRAFAGDVRAALQAALQAHPLDAVLAATDVRALIEHGLIDGLQPVLTAHGLVIEGVRLAEFGGPAVDELREKLGDIDRLTRELEVNRRLQDAVRAGKIDAYHDEQELQDAYDRITHETGLKAVDRTEERKRFVQAAEHRTQMDGLRLDFEARRLEIEHRLQEQTLAQQAQIADAMHQIELRKVTFAEDMRQQRERFHAGQEQQVEQSKTDLEVARSGVEALKLVQQAKIEARERSERLDLALESERLKLRGDASVQALLATLDGPQADRLLKLAELEMRKGLSPEQALALIADKSPEIAPAVAEALKARQRSGGGLNLRTN